MKGYNGNIEDLTKANNEFRHVLYTGKNSQLVLMSIAPGSEIGSEVHPDNDQFFRFEAGQGYVEIDDNRYEVTDGVAIIVPAGSQHNIVNASTTESLKLYTIYSPPHHQDGTIHATKELAEADNEEFDGVTTEK